MRKSGFNCICYLFQFSVIAQEQVLLSIQLKSFSFVVLRMTTSKDLLHQIQCLALILQVEFHQVQESMELLFCWSCWTFHLHFVCLRR